MCMNLRVDSAWRTKAGMRARRPRILLDHQEKGAGTWSWAREQYARNHQIPLGRWSSQSERFLCLYHLT